MAMLMSTCPRCRSEVNTGISADEATQRRLGPKLQVLVLCDDCRAYQNVIKDLYFATDEVAA